MPVTAKAVEAVPEPSAVSVEQTSPSPGVVEILIRIQTNGSAVTVAAAPSASVPKALPGKSRTVPVDIDGKTLPMKKVTPTTRWYEAARVLKNEGFDTAVTDEMVKTVDTSYGRANPRESRLCLLGAQTVLRSYLGGTVDPSLLYSVAGAVVKKYGSQANETKGHDLFIKLLGQPCESASRYINSAVWVVEAYEGK